MVKGRNRMRIAAATLACAISAIGLPAYAGDFGYDFHSPYFQRIDSVTRGAGDAKEVNALTHIINPWPPSSGNRRIPASGERMSGAVERYRDVRRLPSAPPTLAPTTAIGAGGPMEGASGAATPAATIPAAR